MLQRGDKVQNITCPSFQAFDLKIWPLDPTPTFLEIYRLRCTHFNLERGGGNYREETDFSHPGKFKVEFLVQHPKQLKGR
jgi:hypothetical protein